MNKGYNIVVTYSSSKDGTLQVVAYDDITQPRVVELVNNYTTKFCAVQIMLTERDD